jgi:hypothetical protein
MNVFELFGSIAIKGMDTAEKQLQGLEGYVEKNKAGFKAMGAAMTGAGLAITAALTLSVKAAAEEEQGIIKLSKALENVGVDYNVVKKSLDSVISSTMKKTGIADDKQRASLQSLLEVTGDYNKALKLMPLALDLATAKGIDAASAAQIVGKVAQGNTGILARYGVVLKEGATATEALGELQKKFGGQAEAYGKTMSGQLDILKNSFGDIMETIGSQLLPILTDLLKNHISPAIEKIQAWTDANPGLTKTIVIVAGVIGGLLAVMGPLLLILPGLTAGVALFGVALHVAMGPVGWISLAIMGLAAAAILLASNWERITNPLAASIRKQTEAIKAGLEEQKAAVIQSINDKKRLAEKEHEDAVSAIKKQGELLEGFYETKVELAKDASDATKKALEKELKDARSVHDAKITLLNKEYDQKIRTLNAESDAQVKAVQDQIDAIDKQTDAEDRALKKQGENSKLAALSLAVQDAKTDDERASAQTEFNDYLAEVNRDHLLQKREDEKTSLYAQIETIRNNAKDKADVLKDELDENIRQQKVILETVEYRVDQELEKLETALKQKLQWLQDEFNLNKQLNADKITLQDQLLQSSINRLAAEEQATKESYDRQLQQAADFARMRAAALGTYGPGGPHVTAPSVPEGGNKPHQFASGGLITEPSFLTRVGASRPYGIMAERGPETITPGRGYSSANIYVMLDSHVIARAIGQPLVDEIRLKTGVRI